MKRAALFALLLLGCSRENALVDGECASGYVQSDDTCVLAPDGGLDGSNDGDATLSDASDASDDGKNRDVTQLDSPSDSPTDVVVDAITCDDGLTLCQGTCVDTTSDPYNCGSCGVVCPSLLCSNSQCQGSVAGSFVVIGHDYGVTYSAAQARVLGNALLIAPASTIRVRSYEEYAASNAISNVKAILNAAAAGAGRTISYTVATQPTDVSTGMTAANTDVLVVYDQSGAPASTLATIGAGWATAIANFTHVGGVVIALDGAGGKNPQMPALIQSAGILDVSSDTPVAQSSPLDVVAPADVVGVGVVSPYGAGKQSVYFACNEPNGGAVTYVVEDPAGDAGPTQPVVVHKIAP